jgi:hypothetical protein
MVESALGRVLNCSSYIYVPPAVLHKDWKEKIKRVSHAGLHNGITTLK